MSSNPIRHPTDSAVQPLRSRKTGHLVQEWGLLTLAGLPALAVVLLLLAVLWLAFVQGVPALGSWQFTMKNIVDVYRNPFTWQVLANTLIFGIVTVLVALVFGVGFAWVVERTDFPFKRLVYSTMTFSLLIPGFFPAMGWLFLLGPRIGLVSKWWHNTLHLPSRWLNIASPVGMGWVQGLMLASLAFVMIAPTLRAVSSELLEAGQLSGMSLRDRMRFLELPLIRPAMISTAIFIFMIAVASFDVPAFIGLTYRVYTFSSYLYELNNPITGVPAYGQPSALSFIVMLVALLLTLWYQRSMRQQRRFEVVQGRGYRLRLLPLGRRWRWVSCGLGAYLALAIVLPVILVIWTAVIPYFQEPSLQALHSLTWKNFGKIPWAQTIQAFWHTVLLMAVVPVIVIAVGLAASWIIVRSARRWRKWLDLILFLPHAVPNMIFALALETLALFVINKIVHLTGTVAILAIVYVLVFSAFAIRTLSVSLLQVSRDLEDSGRISGMGIMTLLQTILVPLISQAVRNVWVWVALLVFRELTMAVILFTPTNLTLPTVLWNTWYSGDIGASAALSLILMALFTPLAFGYLKAIRQGGVPSTW